jgi:hypothetical protein
MNDTMNKRAINLVQAVEGSDLSKRRMWDDAKSPGDFMEERKKNRDDFRK